MSEKCCGNCMNHVPNDKPVTYVAHSYRGLGGYWMCSRTGEPKKCENGKRCKHFDDRYIDDDRVEEWIGKIHGKRDKQNQS